MKSNIRKFMSMLMVTGRVLHVENIEYILQCLRRNFSGKNAVVKFCRDSTIADRYDVIQALKRKTVLIALYRNLVDGNFHDNAPSLSYRSSVSMLCSRYGSSHCGSSGKRFCRSGMTARSTSRPVSRNSSRRISQSA